MKNTITITKQHRGLIQGEQFAKSIDPEHFLVDERSVMDRLAMMTKLGEVLDYFNLQNKREGSWKSFLMADVAVLASVISQYKGAGDLDEFVHFEEAVTAAENWQMKKMFAQRYYASAFRVILQINSWYQLSGQDFSSNQLTIYLKHIIADRGAELLSRLYELYFLLTESLDAFKNEMLSLFQGLDGGWNFNPFPATSCDQHDDDHKELFLHQNIKTARVTGEAIFSLKREIVNASSEIFQAALRRDNVSPHIGLLLTFLDLMEHQRQAMNTLTRRHLDFYFQSVLKLCPKPATPDKSFLVFDLLPGIPPVSLPKGVLFSAGKEEQGNDIEFELTEPVSLGHAQVEKYVTLNFPPLESGLIQGIFSTEVHEFNDTSVVPWPFFGGQYDAGNVAYGDTASMGFAFSSSDLMLSQGDRTLEISLVLNEATTRYMHALGESAKQSLDTLFASAFEIQFTTTSGWTTADHVTVSYTTEANKLSFVIRLTASSPSIVSYQQKTHGNGYNSKWPVCKFLLTEAGKTCYPFFRKMQVKQVTVSSTVTGVTNFSIGNDSGKLSPSVSFMPFNDPSPGSNLFFFHPEFFCKPLEYFRLNILWKDLPKSFAQYYNAYNDYYATHHDAFRYQNQSFQVTASVRVEGAWTVISNQNGAPAIYNLFTGDDSSATTELPVVANNIKSITLPGTTFCRERDPLRVTAQQEGNTGNICRITLARPQRGFGTKDYPNIVSEVTLENSAAIVHNAGLIVLRKKKLKPLPNIPFVPKIANVTADYKSGSSFDVSAGTNDMQWYHVTPFGPQRCGIGSGMMMFPDYDRNAYVFLGLSAVEPGEVVSMLIAVNHETTSFNEDATPSVVYEYYSASGWKSLPVLRDGTLGLQVPGLFQFAFPGDAVVSETMPGTWHWLRISTSTSTRITARYLATQAVAVQRKIEARTATIMTVVAGTISKPVKPIAGVKAVVQPFDSTGGNDAQTATAFNNSTSVRLRYKGRAATVRDMEALVLTAFPSLYKVTALPLGYCKTARTNKVSVVVIPYTKDSAYDRFRPSASPTLLAQVWDFLHRSSLPDISLETANPNYVSVKVSCSVKFRSALDEGKMIKQLNQDIQNYLSPWMKNNPVTADRTTPFSRHSLYAFIRKLDYISHVGAVAILQPSNLEAIAPDELLVPDDNHVITVLKDAGRQNALGNVSNKILKGLKSH